MEEEDALWRPRIGKPKGKEEEEEEVRRNCSFNAAKNQFNNILE